MRNLKSQLYSIKKTDNGYSLIAPMHRGLVLSGGGAKGIAYAGMIKALHERGRLQVLTHISGSSAGAMTASLIAIGMSPAHITALVTQLDPAKLLDTGSFGARASGVRLRNILDLIYMQQMKEHLAGIPEPTSEKELRDYLLLKQKVNLYDQVLKNQELSINNLQDIINLTNEPSNFKKIDAAFRQLPKKMGFYLGKKLETPRITFMDLERLRSILPDDIRYLIKNLSVVTTNQTKGKLETFNFENAGADKSIAEKVQQSGAHPFLFVPQTDDNGESIADGGILNNMPSQVLEDLGLNIEQMLCVRIEAEASFKARVNRANAHAPEATSEFYDAVDSVANLFLGGRFFKGREEVKNREKIFQHIGNMLYINSGTITTTTTSVTTAQKNQVIENAYRQTNELLDNKNKTFDHPLLAMLYFGADKLDDIARPEDTEKEIYESAFQAKLIFSLQYELVNELYSSEFKGIEDHILLIEDTLKRGVKPLNEKQQKQAMAFCLKQVDYLSEGRLESYIKEQIDLETNGPKVHWFQRLLELLYVPIAWIISLFSRSKPEIFTNNSVAEDLSLEVNATKKPKLSPLKILGLFTPIEEVVTIGVVNKVTRDINDPNIEAMSLQLG